MPMNGALLEALDDETFESLDDESLDDESYDDESEFLGGLLGGAIPSVGPIGSAIGSILRPSSRPRIPGVTLPNVGGISTATLNTPNGQATLRLPSAVVSKSDFERITDELRDGINKNSGRLNSIQSDIEKLGSRVTTVVNDTRAEVAKANVDVRRNFVKLRKEARAAFGRMRKRQGDQQMMTMMMSMMATNQQQSAFDAHTHTSHADGVPTSAPIQAGQQDNNRMMMMLPMMMMGGGSDSKGGGNDNMMMMMAMMFAFQK